jgi:hypothetical protein
MRSAKWDLIVGIVLGVVSLITLLAWIPNDVETGVFVADRYSVNIGDAFAPTMIAILVLIVSTLLAIRSALILVRRNTGPGPQVLSPANGVFVASLLCIVVVAMVLMTWGGPALVATLKPIGIDLGSYRLLIDRVPYKYTGFVLGGFALVFGLISLIEGRTSRYGALTAILAVAALILLYDIPFSTLLLPPNGSQ